MTTQSKMTKKEIKNQVYFLIVNTQLFNHWKNDGYVNVIVLYSSLLFEHTMTYRNCGTPLKIDLTNIPENEYYNHIIEEIDKYYRGLKIEKIRNKIKKLKIQGILQLLRKIKYKPLIR